MPELPEVENVVRGLLDHLIGKKIVTVDIFKPLVLKSEAASFVSTVTNKTIQKISRHGKSIFLTFDENSHMKVHLGMSGALLFRPKEKALDSYVRLRFRLDDPQFDLVYRDVRQFGRIALSVDSFERLWGPDAWTSDSKKIFSALRQKKGMIKHALMNQNVIAGLGNIYVDETLFDARIHPKQRMERLSNEKIQLLTATIHNVLKRAIEAGGTSFRDYVNAQGKRGKFSRQLRVYGRDGEPCVICGSKIKKMIVASRGTHYCTKCQR